MSTLASLWLVFLLEATPPGRSAVRAVQRGPFYRSTRDLRESTIDFSLVTLSTLG